MKILKILGIGFGALVALVVAAMIIVPMVIDPNDYRDKITAVVKEATGRELRIIEPMKLSVFPWLGIKLGKVEFSNAPGFGAQPFAAIEGAQVKVKLLPLLRKRVEMDTITLDGLRLNLARNSAGVNNWDDLVKPAAAEEQKPEEPAAKGDPLQALARLAIGGIQFSDAQLVWDDQQQKQRAEISALNLTSGELSIERPFPLTLDLDFALRQPELKGHLHLASTIGLLLKEERYSLQKTELTLDAEGKMLPGGKTSARLRFDAEADLKQQLAKLSGLSIEALGTTINIEASAEQILADPAAKATLKAVVKDGKALTAPFSGSLPAGFNPAALNGAGLDLALDLDMAKERLQLTPLKVALLDIELNGSVQGSQLKSVPSFKGELKSNAFVPRDLLDKLKVTLPEMADPSTLTKAALALNFEYGNDRAALDKVVINLDQSTITASAAVKNFARPAVRYDLNLDTIDVDRYLPPPPEPQQKEATVETAEQPVELPLEMMRSLDISGTARIGKLKVMNLRSEAIVVTLTARDGLIRLNPLGAKLYQGSYSGNISLDVRGDKPLLGLDEKLSGVQAGPLLKDFMGEEYVSGKANVTAKLTARGLEPSAVRKSLNGTASFSFENGAVKGINIAQLLRDGYSSYKKQPAAPERAKQTDFAEMRGSVTITDGLVKNNDLSVKSPLLRVEGKGNVHLVQESIDYRVDTKIVGSLEGEGGKSLDELKGLTIPIRIGGTFTTPKFSLDMGEVLSGKAKAVVEEKKQQAQEAVQQKADEQKKRLEEDAKKKLKNLLKF